MLDLLRPGVLDGAAVCVAGGGAEVAARCAALGATVAVLDADLLDEEAVAAAVGALGRVDVLVADAATPFAAVGGGAEGLRVAVDGAWNAVRAAANACWVAGGDPGGKAILVAPATGEHAVAAAAALENAARTLSVEWARFGVRVTALRPGPAAGAGEIAELAAFLASAGGDYFSGCAFTLRGL